MDNSPNTNIMVINEIEGLLSQAYELLQTLTFDDEAQFRVLSDVRGNFDDWLKCQMEGLKEVFG